MSPERPQHRPPRRWAFRSTWGELAFAGVWLAVASGIALAVPYDAQHAYDSVALVLLTNPAAAFFRNIHYWAAQLFLILTLAHAWDHLSRWTESRVPRTMWWRVTASAPLAVFVMLSGFMLKGDAEAQQALRIVTTLLEHVPWVGRLLSVAVFGTESNRQILYVQHVATASLLTWLFVAEHARAIWPRLVTIVEAFVPIALVSLFVSPALHDALDPIVKGPWYFLGLQEALHWSSRPVLLLGAGVVFLAVVAALPRMSDRAGRAAKAGLLIALVIYSGLTIVGFSFRGANWAWSVPELLGGTGAGAPSTGLVLHGLGPWWAAPAETVVRKNIPVVLGRREGCLFCHDGMRGLSAAHSAEAVGCASCHAGNPFSLDKATAHAGVVLIPGNLATASRACGTAACHPSQVERVSGSLMASMAGIVAVDRAVFGGETAGASRLPASGRVGRPAAGGGSSGADGGLSARFAHIESLGHTGADSHLRQLCASCHLGATKSVLGPIGEDSRGGGCNACHLTYSTEARAQLARYDGERTRVTGSVVSVALPGTHPNVSILIERQACFGCHSRSGRISTSYEGWMEQSTVDSQRSKVGSRESTVESQKRRVLADGRVFTFVAADVHAKSMDCVDCHTSREVMGDGVRHSRAHEAVRIACTDCHVAPAGEAAPRPSVVTFEQLDAESRRIAQLRHRDRPGERFLATADGAQPLLNTVLDLDDTAWLLARASGERLPLKPPAAVCLRSEGHARLSCISCHAVWSPRCPQCHTSFDPGLDAVDLLDERTTKGAWVETAGPFEATPPTLGMRTVPAGRGGGSVQARTVASSVVDTFIPGMILTINRSQAPEGGAETVFRRLYARSFSHTIGKSRSCVSCHADPVALGYGEGELRYERDGQVGRWRFTPRAAPGPDGLPGDAWVGFLQERTSGASTRGDVRPFNVEEQKRILVVGACLTCHRPTADGAGIKSCARTGGGAPADSCAPMPPFREALTRASTRCLLPRW